MEKRWYTGKSPESREQHAERLIYGILPDDGSEVQWSQLRQMAKEKGISSATLNKHLKHGVGIGMIGRRVDESTYPPNVYYRKASDLIPEAKSLLLQKTESIRESFEMIDREENVKKKRAMVNLLWQHMFTYLNARLSTWIINSCEKKKTFQEAEDYIKTALNIEIIPNIEFLHRVSYHAKPEILPTLNKVSGDFFFQLGMTLMNLYILSKKKELTEQEIERLSDIWTAVKEEEQWLKMREAERPKG